MVNKLEESLFGSFEIAHRYDSCLKQRLFMEIAHQKGCPRRGVKHRHFKKRIPLEEGVMSGMPWKFY